MSKKPNFYVYALFRETGIPFYIGKGYGDRWSCHERQSRHDTRSHKSSIIRGMRINGHEVIKVKLHDGLAEAVASEYEIALIRAIGRTPNGPLANLTDGGEGVTGLRHTEEARISISLAHRGREKSPEECANIASGKLGSRASMEARANMSAAHIGKKLSAETRAKMSLVRLGKPKTPEHIEKVASARRGLKFSPEWRAKLSAAHIGKKQSPEHIEKAAATRRGKKQSPEHIAKRVEATRRAKEERRII